MNHSRRSEIADMIERNRTITNAEIMEKFGVSIETVRRDLAYLEQRGILDRVYGGAVRKRFMSIEPAYDRRERDNENEKNAIAKEAEKFIETGDTVFFDSGTTLLSLARIIDANKRITAFTNSLRIAVELSSKCESVIVPGGELRKEEHALSGFLAEENMKRFHIDKIIIGAGGVTEEGISDFVLPEAGLRTQVIKRAQTVIAVADSSKLGVNAMCHVCDIKDIDVLITDEKSPVELLRKIEKKGVKVVVVRS